jgi:cytochrome c5
MKTLAITLLSIITLYSCKGKQKGESTAEAYLPGDKELAVAQKTWPTVSLEELKEGNSIYRNQCRECHKNFEITKFSEKKWKHEIDDMSPKAKLTADQKDKLTKFILSYREANAAAK